MTPYQSTGPSVFLRLMLWVAAGVMVLAGVILGGTIIDEVTSPALFFNNPFGFVIILLASVAGIGGVLVGVSYLLLGGVLKRVLNQSDRARPPNRLPYRLIHLGFGCAVGAAFVAMGLFALGTFADLWRLAVIAIPLGAAASLSIGEILRGQYERAADTSAPRPPPQPFPPRELTRSEDELLDDMERVLQGLENAKATRREATLIALGQLVVPEPEVLAAVNRLAAHDSIDYVRDAARSVLVTWGKPLPVEAPPGGPLPPSEPQARLEPASVPEGTAGEGWEFCEFVFAWVHKTWQADAILSDDKVRQLVWEAYQPQISAELKTVLDDRWQVVDAVGPSAIKTARFAERSPGGCLFAIFGLFLSGGGYRDEAYPSYVEPTEFRVLLRRTRTSV